MNRDERKDPMGDKVVVHHEEQSSIWSVAWENPLYWKEAVKSGPKADCLAYIPAVWTDRRPLSRGKRMAGA